MVTQRSNRQMPVAQQLRRMAELDALRLQRGLTASELAEADNLAYRTYQREWRAMQRENAMQIAARIAARGASPSFRTHGGAA